MLLNLLRVVVGGVSAAVAIITLTTNYYAQTIEILNRIVKLVDVAIPAVLAVALLYHVVERVSGESGRR